MHNPKVIPDDKVPKVRPKRNDFRFVDTWDIVFVRSAPVINILFKRDMTNICAKKKQFFLS